MDTEYDVDVVNTESEPGEDESGDQSIKDKVQRSLYEHLESKGNYFIVALLALVSLLFSFVRFDNATVSIKLPQYDNIFGWAVFVFMTVVPAAIGITIKAVLRRQGIKMAMRKESIAVLQDKYDGLLTVKSVKKRPPRSLSEYQRSSLGKEILINTVMILVTSTLMMGVALSAGLEGLVKQLINFLMWAIFGLLNMFNANDYVLTEYKRWLIIHIKELEETQKQG